MSWGKDSVTTAHLARSVRPDLAVVWLRLLGAENPDCEAVRDAYLSEWPSNYDEIEVQCEWDAEGDMLAAPWARALVEGRRRHGDRRIMGIRASESRTRALSASIHGVATATVCRPILDWPTADVFAYLLAHDLPIHPTYAMTMGGRLDIEHLRVDLIGGPEAGDTVRPEWERRYYGDVLRAQGLWAAKT